MGYAGRIRSHSAIGAFPIGLASSAESGLRLCARNDAENATINGHDEQRWLVSKGGGMVPEEGLEPSQGYRYRILSQRYTKIGRN